MSTSLPSLQASKWLHTQVLLDPSEMSSLLAALGEVHIYLVGALHPKGKGELSKEVFLTTYTAYIEQLQQGEIREETFRQAFSSALSLIPEAVSLLVVNEVQELIRATQPVVQLQLHRIGYSPMDGQFRPMAFGTRSISWGIQFSYPQLFQDPVTKKVQTVTESELFPNTLLYKQLQRWVRHHTLPTPFEVDGVRSNVPMRLGKNCFAWINNHPQLHEQGIRVIAHS